MDKPMLIAEELAQDPRVAQAKKLLLEAVSDQQKKLTTIKPSSPELREHYLELVETFANQRGGKLWFPYLGSGIGRGPLVELADGSVKYDFITGIGPNYFGHNHPEVISACIDAAISNTVMQGNLQQNVDSAELCELLVQQSRVLDHCFLSTTGGMANENAFKVIFQHKFPAQRVLAFDRCFMGRTLIMSQVTDKAHYREGLPLNLQIDYVPFYDPQDPDGSTTRAVAILRKHLGRYPNQYAMMCIELIQGDGGFHCGTKEFFLAIITVLMEHKVAILIDEVQTFGRTSELFAFQHFGLEEYVDVVTIGKLSQVCATLFKKDYKPRPGLLSQTFTSSTAAIKAGHAIISSMIRNNFFGHDGKVMQFSEYMIKKLEVLALKYPHLIEGPFGLGAMIAFTPLNGDAKEVNKFVLELFDEGVIAFTTGAQPTRVRFLAPIGAISFQDVDKVMEILENVLRRHV